jgi:hypothetical protein
LKRAEPGSEAVAAAAAVAGYQTEGCTRDAPWGDDFANAADAERRRDGANAEDRDPVGVGTGDCRAVGIAGQSPVLTPKTTYVGGSVCVRQFVPMTAALVAGAAPEK